MPVRSTQDYHICEYPEIPSSTFLYFLCALWPSPLNHSTQTCRRSNRRTHACFSFATRLFTDWCDVGNAILLNSSTPNPDMRDTSRKKNHTHRETERRRRITREKRKKNTARQDNRLVSKNANGIKKIARANKKTIHLTLPPTNVDRVASSIVVFRNAKHSKRNWIILHVVSCLWLRRVCILCSVLHLNCIWNVMCICVFGVPNASWFLCGEWPQLRVHDNLPSQEPRKGCGRCFQTTDC